MDKTTNKHLKKNSVPVLKIFLIISIFILLANGVHFALTYEIFFNYISIIGSSFFIIYILFFYKKEKKIDELSQSNNEENNDFLDDNEICLESRKIEPLINIIKSHSSLSFFSMALIGKWGSGKSSYLKTLESKLNGEYEIIKINVWKLENSKNITNEIRKEFDNIIFESNRVLWLLQLIKRLFIRDYFAILSKYATKYEIKASFSFEPTISASQNDFNNLLKEILGNKKVLLLIDELDRLESKDEIINIFKVIRYTASFDNVFVITALDIQQIENKLDDIEYIHKIFNLKYLVPNIDRNELIKYIEKNIIPKFKKFSINKRELDILPNGLYGNDILNVFNNYREIKNIFNDTYSFINYLEENSEDWNEYIDFKFIFILNSIKAVDFKLYSELLFDEKLSKVMKYSNEVTKENSNKELDKLRDKINKIRLTSIFTYINMDKLRQYIDIYQQHKIYDYHVSKTKYNSYIEDINILEETFNSLIYDKEDKEKLLLNVLDKNQKDKKNHSLVLNKVIELMPKGITIYGKESKILEKLAIESFITKETKNIFIKLLKLDGDIPLVFMNYLFIELSKNTNNINHLIKSLICEYFKNLEIEDSEFNQHIQNLFRSIDKNNIFKIYKTVYECFEGNRKIKKALLSNIHIKSIEKFMKEIETSLDDFIDDNDEYTIWIGHNTKRQLLNGKKLKEEFYKLKNKDIKGNE